VPKVYTKTGDDGTSSLASGERVDKFDLRLEAYGTIDELNSFIGWAQEVITSLDDRDTIQFVQHKLFNIGSILAKGDADYPNYPDLIENDVLSLEKAIDRIESILQPLSHFILPAGSESISRIHICRTVCRRAERRVVVLEIDTSAYSLIIRFLNRLSDYFFVLARKLAQDDNQAELKWDKDCKP
jgi:cob(I)alamin adenosyltransferase